MQPSAMIHHPNITHPFALRRVANSCSGNPRGDLLRSLLRSIVVFLWGEKKLKYQDNLSQNVEKMQF
jgi:hypothetical protein